MSRVAPDQLLIPSVLDRLIDYDPTVGREVARSRSQVLAEMKESLRRDLENLLNTRWRCVGWPPHLTELNTSLVNYGIPDIAGVDLASAEEREKFRRTLEDIVARFEPRFKSVKIVFPEQGQPIDRTLKFRIDGLMRVEPSPEPVAFDSAVEPATGNVTIRKAAGR